MEMKLIPKVSEVYDTVLSLPVKYRTVIHLHYYEGMSVTDYDLISGSLMLRESSGE
jgi:hypothetical protein